MNSAAAIEVLLVEAGATTVSKWYQEKHLIGFIFELPINGLSLVFRLPANVQRVTDFMLKQKPKANAQQRLSIRAQAYRTAWRSLHELVQIQVAMIQMQQMDPLQVFLAQQYNQNTGATHYQEVKAGNVKLLGV
ncbi:hypothetical protein [Hymenobacter seoulensis]